MQQFFHHEALVLRYQTTTFAPSKGPSKLWVLATTTVYIEREHSIALIYHDTKLKDPQPGSDPAWLDTVDEARPPTKRIVVDLLALPINHKDDLALFRHFDRDVRAWNVVAQESYHARAIGGGYDLERMDLAELAEDNQ